jgi:hypothetical protein
MLNDLKKPQDLQSWDVAIPTTILTTIEAVDPDAAIKQALAEIKAMAPDKFKGMVVPSIDSNLIRVRQHDLPLPKLTGEIQEIAIFSPGDHTVGIPDFHATITDLGIDANEYEPEQLQEFREEIEVAFSHLWGEKVMVSFDQEFPKDENDSSMKP